MDKNPEANSIQKYQLDILKMYIHNVNSITINPDLSKKFGLGDISEIKPTLNYSVDKYQLDYKVIKRRKDVDVVYKNMEMVLDKDPDALDNVLERLDNIIYDLHLFIYDTEILLSESVKKQILRKYYELTGQDNTKFKNLMVPQPVTLTKKNINIYNTRNIIRNYLVTEKADGDRYVLYIDDLHNGYLINNKMQVVSTGMSFPNIEGEWILDGEYIKHDKNNKKINLYMIFDVYVSDNKPVYKLPFKSSNYSRGEILNELKEKVSNVVFSDDVTNKLSIEFKEYKDGSKKIYRGKETFDNNLKIFEESEKIWNIRDDFKYKIDGLIYLPATLPVSADINGVIPNNIGITWTLNYKWKPEDLNTIDFLVEIEPEYVNRRRKDKINSAENDDGNPVMYKTLILKNRYNIRYDDVTDFCMEMLSPIGKLPKTKIFQPNVSEEFKDKIDLSRANIILKNNKLLCENGQEIRSGSIVEMRYDGTKKHNMVWIPLRVRLDKPTENSYDTAMKVWETIENPITDEMICGDVDIKTVGNDIVLEKEYYGEKRDSTMSEPLKNLHNYIKNILITGVGSSEELNGKIQIMDTSIGQGGDLNRYFTNYIHCSFLFGLDISPVREACKRYITKRYYEKKYKVPHAIFIQYDTSHNIITKEGLDENDVYQKNILNSLYNSGPIDPEYNYINKFINKKGNQQFDMISCQFSFHYYFKDMETLNGYLTNISENCKSGGYFIGCCYDGKRIFNRLQDPEPFEYKNKYESVIYSVEKNYDIDSFDYNDNDEAMLGNSITVEMESIGTPIEEYLVNFDFFVKKMKEYGFEPHLPNMKKSKYKKYNLDTGIGSFKSIIDSLKERSEEDERFKPNKIALDILKDEKLKELSSMNNWFIFRKN